MQKNHDVEALRAAAICLTMAAHLPIMAPMTGPWLSFFWLGGGVDLFFAISGFVISTSLLRSMRDRVEFSTYAASFWIRRVLRLWPAAVFWSTCVLLLAAVWPAARSPVGEWHDVLLTWLADMSQVQNIAFSVCAEAHSCSLTAITHYWSLSLEEQFYFILPFVLYFVRARKPLAWVLLALALMQAAMIRTWPYLPWTMRTDAMLYGVVIGILWNDHRTAMERLFVWRWRWLVAAMIAIFMACLVFVTRATITPYYVSVVTASAGCIVFLVAPNRDYLTNAAVIRRFTDYIGARSYSLYIVHAPVYFLVAPLVARHSSGFLAVSISAAAIAIIIVIADLSYRVESLLRAYGRRVANGIVERATTSLPADAERAVGARA